MSLLGWGTWAAIAVLVLGSTAVFTWFLVDLWSAWRRRRGR